MLCQSDCWNLKSQIKCNIFQIHFFLKMAYLRRRWPSRQHHHAPTVHICCCPSLPRIWWTSSQTLGLSASGAKQLLQNPKGCAIQTSRAQALRSCYVKVNPALHSAWTGIQWLVNVYVSLESRMKAICLEIFHDNKKHRILQKLYM